MKLVLDLLGPPRLMGARQRFELRAGSVSIGRSPEADWVIPDTDRLISRVHLRIDASHGEFMLTDTSANGVYVNGRDEPVGYGASVKLRDGDQLRVGEAEIAVTIEGGPPAVAPEPPAGRPFALDANAFAARVVPPPAPRDPLGGPFDGPFGGTSGTAPIAPRAAEPPASRTVIDANWMNDLADAAPAQNAPSAGRQERGRPVILPLRPGGPPPGGQAPGGQVPGGQVPGGQTAPLRAVPSPAPEPPGLLALVESHPDLSIQRLAAAVDDAGRAMDRQAWQDFQDKVKAFIKNDSI